MDIFGLGRKQGNYERRIMTIAIPVIIQFSISISLNLVDSLMIGRTGVYPMAGVGAANELYYILSITVYGLCSGASVYLAQFWGAQDIPGIRRVLGITYTCVAVLVSVGSVLIWVFAPKLVWLYSRQPEVIQFGTQYLRVVAFSYLITSISDVISMSSRAVQRLKVTTIIIVIAILINVSLNYCLIYGKFGFSEMGVTGAAIATVIARVFQITGFLIYLYRDRSHPLAGSFHQLFAFRKKDVKDVLKMSLPVTLSEGGWSVANSLYYIAYGLIGAKALAAAQVVVIIGKIAQSFFGGFSNAAGILIGEQLGKGNRSEAQSDGKIFVRIVFVMGIAATVLMFFSGGLIASVYRFDQETTLMITRGIQVFSGFIMIKMFGYLFVCGILRCGGDTRFCMFVDLGCSWLISVPLVFLGVKVLHTSLPVAVALVYSSEIVKCALCFFRFYSGKWIRTLVKQKNGETVAKAEEVKAVG